MKKLILATVVASLSFGASAAQFNRTIDFTALTNSAEKKIDISGHVPNRCLLRLGRAGVADDLDVLTNAKYSANEVGAGNKKVLVANLRAWCNYGKGLKVEFESDNGGLKQANGNKIIPYRLSANEQRVFNTAGSVKSMNVDWDGTHLENDITRIPLYIRPVKAGFARAGNYQDTITVTLVAGMRP